MKFDLTDLQLFLNIVDAGSITAGAERSHLALASASERLRKMEQSLGIALLVRLPRGTEVTAAGAALAHHARLMWAWFQMRSIQKDCLCTLWPRTIWWCWFRNRTDA